MDESPCGFKSHLRHIYMPKRRLPFKEFTWTPELAYVIGLIVTDGNLSKDGRHINMRSSDTDLLKTFQLILNLNAKITRSYNNGFAKKPSYRIQFSDVQFYNWLINIGITPAKTYTIGEVKIPKKYFRDFLRGHLDGDGTIFTYIDNYNHYRGRTYTNQRIFTKFISASQLHITWLHNRIKKLAQVQGALICNSPTRPNRVPMWEIKFSKYESLKLFKWLYYDKNLPTLKRKRYIAENLLHHVVNNKLIRLT